MFTDSHCHLTYEGIFERLDSVREDMRLAGVSRALCICTKMEEFERVHGLALGFDDVWASVGVHPDMRFDDNGSLLYEPSVQELVQACTLPKVVAVGETGLDYYQMDERKGGQSIADLNWQRDRFRTHIRAARQAGLPLVIHTRCASEDTIGILKEEGESGGSGSAGGVFHCFTESMEVARAALDLGFYISFSGIVTFKSAKELQKVAAFVPDDRILIETDAPYLAPVPHRGKTNSPAFVPFVAQHVAMLRRRSVEDIAQLTTDNFLNLFKKAK